MSRCARRDNSYFGFPGHNKGRLERVALFKCVEFYLKMVQNFDFWVKFWKNNVQKRFKKGRFGQNFLDEYKETSADSCSAFQAFVGFCGHGDN